MFADVDDGLPSVARKAEDVQRELLAAAPSEAEGTTAADLTPLHTPPTTPSNPVQDEVRNGGCWVPATMDRICINGHAGVVFAVKCIKEAGVHTFN